jgi:probable HAF family extracellular repeat protein
MDPTIRSGSQTTRPADGTILPNLGKPRRRRCKRARLRRVLRRDWDSTPPYLWETEVRQHSERPGAGPSAASGLSSLTSQAVNAPGSGLVFQNSFSLDGSFASLTSTEQAAYEADIRQAELDLSGEFTNSLTANVDFEAPDVPPNPDGSGFNAANQSSFDVTVSLSAYLNALQSVAATSFQSNAIAALRNRTDLGQNPEILLPISYARMLGLSNAGTVQQNTSVTLGSTNYNLSTSVDDTVFLNIGLVKSVLDSQSANTTNAAIVGVLEHELSEDVMGRIGELQSPLWGPSDLFRVNSAGQPHLTPDDGTAVFFSPAPGVTAPVSGLEFNNVSSQGDFADWTYAPFFNPPSDPNLTDPFGPGDLSSPPGSISSALSPTDIDLMNVLGWTIAGSASAPPLTIALKNDTGASNTDRLTSDPTLTGLAAPNVTVTLTSETNAVLGTATADAGGTWLLRPTLADGQHTVTASEPNGAGTLTASLTFVLATSAPTGHAMESASGQTSQTSDTITVTAAAENVGSNAIAGVEIFDGSADLGAATLSNGSWTFTAQHLLPSVHNFTAKATDLAGNSASFALQQVTVTGSAPPVNNHYVLSQFAFQGTGVTDIRPKGINDFGEIVGYYIDARADDIGADGQTYFEHGFYSTLSNGVRQYTSIDNPDSPIDSQVGEFSAPDRTRAFAVNNNGDIVGWYSQDELGVADNGMLYVLPDAGFIKSVSWPGTYGTLGYSAVGDFGTHALGINSGDEIVGYYVDGSGRDHGFLRNFTGFGVRGNYVSLDPANSISTVAEGINDSGQIIGFYQTPDLVYHGFLYNSGTGAYVPVDYNGAAGTEALGVNNSGEIVGIYWDSAGTRHGFVLSSSGNFTTIDDPNAGSGGTLVGGINNKGEIVGWYTGADGHDHGFTGVVTPTPTDDFDGDGVSDILFRNDASGETWFEAMKNGMFQGWNPIGGSSTTYTAVGVGDFYGTNATGDTWIETISNGAFAGWSQIGGSDTHYSVVGVADFFGNGTDDILFRANSSGDTWIEAISKGAFAGWHPVGGSNTSYAVVGVGDFYGNGTADILFRNNSSGDTWIEAISNGASNGWHEIGGSNTTYSVVGVGDFYGTGTDDILFRNNSIGDTWIEAISNGASAGWKPVGGSDTHYAVAAVGDYFGNGTDDILFRNNSTGDTWFEAISNGASAGWNPIGGSNTGYTVKT